MPLSGHDSYWYQWNEVVDNPNAKPHCFSLYLFAEQSKQNKITLNPDLQWRHCAKIYGTDVLPEAKCEPQP